LDDRVPAARGAARQYFSQPGFARFLAELRIRYQTSLAGPRGYIRLASATAEERAALDGFYGSYTPPARIEGAALKFSIKQFERLLLASRFKLTLSELFAVLDGTPLTTRGEQEAEEDAAWQAMIGRIAEPLPPSGSSVDPEPEPGGEQASLLARLADWMRGLGDGTSSGYRTLRALFAEDRAAAEACLLQCRLALLAAIERQRGATAAPAPLLRLPILAARLTGDAHALDWKHPLGRLFWWGLARIFGGSKVSGQDELEFGDGEEVAGSESVFAADTAGSNRDFTPESQRDHNSESDSDNRQPDDASHFSRALLIRETYRRGGIADDDLSSQVLIFTPGSGDRPEEQVLTLRQVEKLQPEYMKLSGPSAVFMVENPSVFAVLTDGVSDLLNLLRPSSPPAPEPHFPILVCGNGQPSVAVIQYLSLLLETPRAYAPLLFYSGDLDVAGLEIARSMQLRFPAAFRAWRMDAALHRCYADCGMPMSRIERDRVARLKTPWDAELPKTMADSGVKLHQELWVDELAKDWLVAISRAMS